MTPRAIRAVFDTNILISGHFWRGAPHQCVLAAEAGVVVLVFTEPTVSEFRDKLTHKFKRSATEVSTVIGRLNAYAEHIPARGGSGWIPADPDDDKFIDAALTGRASIIVSGDRHLLDLNTVEGIAILTARQFLDRLPTLSGETERTKR